MEGRAYLHGLSSYHSSSKGEQQPEQPLHNHNAVMKDTFNKVEI